MKHCQHYSGSTLVKTAGRACDMCLRRSCDLCASCLSAIGAALMRRVPRPMGRSSTGAPPTLGGPSRSAPSRARPSRTLLHLPSPLAAARRANAPACAGMPALTGTSPELTRPLSAPVTRLNRDDARGPLAGGSPERSSVNHMSLISIVCRRFHARLSAWAPSEIKPSFYHCSRGANSTKRTDKRGRTQAIHDERVSKQ